MEHTARLAKLRLNEKEVRIMTKQLDTILSYVAKLDEIDTEGIVPTTHVLPISNAFREDSVKDSLPQKDALANCAHQDGKTFIVPRII